MLEPAEILTSLAPRDEGAGALAGLGQPVSDNPGLLCTVHRNSSNDIIKLTGLLLF